MGWFRKGPIHAPWRNPYFHVRKASHAWWKKGMWILSGLLLISWIAWIQNTWLAQVRVDGAESELSQKKIATLIEQRLNEEFCARFFSCRQALLLNHSRVRTWLAPLEPRVQVIAIEERSGELLVRIREEPAVFHVLVGEEVWLLNANAEPLQTLTTVERVRMAVEDPVYKGIQWQDQRQEPRSLEERKSGWQQMVDVWNQVHRIPCQPKQAFIEEQDAIRLEVLCEEKSLYILFTLRRDLEEQWKKVELFFQESFGQVQVLEYIDARYHQRLFYK